MTLKTSFFNKGIYKSTVKRYAWGALLYFIILFSTTVLSLFLNIDRDFIYLPQDFFNDYSVILHGAYIAVPMLCAIAVPSVTALLVFRYLHSKKQIIFTGSLPVSRKAAFISTLLGGFTLMLLPILVNGLLLILLSVFVYGQYFNVMDCFIWTGLNVLGVFMMFSCAAFSAAIAGNSFAALAVNGLMHGLIPIAVLTFSVMAELLIHGFTEANAFYETLFTNNFAVAVFSMMERSFRDSLTPFRILIFSEASLLLYVASFFLAVKRRPETAGDVAGFSCLRPVLKYIVTFLVTMFAFAASTAYIGSNLSGFICILVLCSLTAFAACEMVLKKTVKVFYAWKGYAAFSLFFLIFTLLIAHTSCFGYETAVPQKEEVREAAVYNFYQGDEEPFSAEPALIEAVINTHTSLTAPASTPVLNPMLTETGPHDYTRLHILYKLQNGKTVRRAYVLTEDEVTAIMNTFYENEAYKKACEPAFTAANRITRIFVDHEYEIEDKNMLLTALHKDILALSYAELYPKTYASPDESLYSVRLEYTVKAKPSDDGKPRAVISGRYITVTSKFVNTLKVLAENGFPDKRGMHDR